jgi:hypothetical protein
MRGVFFLLIIVLLVACSPEGPITYTSPLVGKTRAELIKEKGTAQKIKVFEKSEAYIYVVREAYFGKVKEIKPETKPKQMVEIEHIYYIDANDKVYKYQVWKKKIK